MLENVELYFFAHKNALIKALKNTKKEYKTNLFICSGYDIDNENLIPLSPEEKESIITQCYPKNKDEVNCTPKRLRDKEDKETIDFLQSHKKPRKSLFPDVKENTNIKSDFDDVLCDQVDALVFGRYYTSVNFSADTKNDILSSKKKKRINYR